MIDIFIKLLLRRASQSLTGQETWAVGLSDTWKTNSLSRFYKPLHLEKTESEQTEQWVRVEAGSTFINGCELIAVVALSTYQKIGWLNPKLHRKAVPLVRVFD